MTPSGYGFFCILFFFFFSFFFLFFFSFLYVFLVLNVSFWKFWKFWKLLYVCMYVCMQATQAISEIYDRNATENM